MKDKTMNPALIKLSGRTYRSRSQAISYTYCHEPVYHINSSEFGDNFVKSISSGVQIMAIFLAFSCPCF